MFASISLMVCLETIKHPQVFVGPESLGIFPRSVRHPMPCQALGSCSEKDIAVRVLMRVIGAYPKKNLLLVVPRCQVLCQLPGKIGGHFFPKGPKI